MICSRFTSSTSSRLPGVSVQQSPIIQIQATNTNVITGETATFHIVVTGSQPLGYRWQHNGVDLADSTLVSGSRTDTLTIFNANSTDAGDYLAVVTNSIGSAVSNPASLTVQPLAALPPAIEAIHMHCAGLTITGTVNSVYSIQASPTLGPNATWTTLTNLALTSSPLPFLSTLFRQLSCNAFTALPLGNSAF